MNANNLQNVLMCTCLFQAKEHEIESKKAMKRLLQGTITVGKMEEKLKV
jgi:hypothetical protein